MRSLPYRLVIRTKQPRPAAFSAAQNPLASPASAKPPTTARYQVRPSTRAFSTQASRPPSLDPRAAMRPRASASEGEAPTWATSPPARPVAPDGAGFGARATGVASDRVAGGEAVSCATFTDRAPNGPLKSASQAARQALSSAVPRSGARHSD